MSRHKNIRNRTYSYDEDYDDYYDEEEEYYEDYHEEARPDQQQDHSLSSYFDVATSSASKKKATPKKGGGASTPPKSSTPTKGGSPKGAAASTGTRAPNDFDADLLRPSLNYIRTQPGMAELKEADIIEAVRGANYDVSLAITLLRSKFCTGPSALARALADEGEEPRAPIPVPPGFGEQSTQIPFQFNTPSPDDVAKAGRARSIGSKTLVMPTASSSATSTPVKNLTEGMAQVHLSKHPHLAADRATPSPPTVGKDKAGGEGETGLAARTALLHRDPEVWEEDVLEGMHAGEEEVGGGKSRLSMVVIGHVDAGKSTLMGQVLVGMGIVSEREIRRYEKEARDMGKASFFLAWVMDEDSEERAHGVTMEVAQKSIETPHRHITLLDAPGHHDFIPQMISGAAQADVAVLVVPATPGEFESAFSNTGQTKEHALLARALGVTQVLVAVNKLDATDPPWSVARYEEVKDQVGTFLETAGFRHDKIRYIPVSGLIGENVVKRNASCLLSQWYSGPTLIEAMDAFAPTHKQQTENLHKPLRIFVTDSSPSGKNSVVLSVRVVQGVLKSTNSKVLIMPVGDVGHVKSLERDGKPVEVLMAGDNADIILQGVNPQRVPVGSVLCKAKAAVPVTSRFVAQITTLPSLEVPILRGTQFQLHMQSLEVPSYVTKLIATLKKSGEPKQEKPRLVPASTMASVEVRCQRPLCLEKFTDSKALGRFILRHKGDTLAVGMITDIIMEGGGQS